MTTMTGRAKLPALLAAGALTLAACNGEAPGPDDPEAGPDAELEEMTLRFAHVYETTAPTHECGADLLPDMVADADVGLTVEVYPAAQLGDESDIVEQVATGQLEMAIAGPAFLGTWHEPIGVFDAAYVFEDTDHMLEVARGDIGQQMWDELLEQNNIRVLDTWPYGERHITSNTPITSPEDLDGFRLRMPDADMWLESGRAMGASPTPVAFAETYLALQQGVVDGQENPIPTIRAMAFHEVQDYLNLTAHIVSSTQNLIAEPIWQQMAPDQQEALEGAFADLVDEMAECLERQDQETIEEWEETGDLEINDGVDIDAFRQQAQEHFSEGFAVSDLYNEIAGQN